MTFLWKKKQSVDLNYVVFCFPSDLLKDQLSLDPIKYFCVWSVYVLQGNIIIASHSQSQSQSQSFSILEIFACLLFSPFEIIPTSTAYLLLLCFLSVSIAVFYLLSFPFRFFNHALHVQESWYGQSRRVVILSVHHVFHTWCTSRKKESHGIFPMH